MKICCDTGKEIKTYIDRLSCQHDHCTGAKEMKIPIPTLEVQSWQVDGWMEQAYIVMSFVEGYQGPIKAVSPGKITIAGQGGVDLVVESIPSTSVQLQDPYILIGYPECLDK